jgi:hypothetical protein
MKSLYIFCFAMLALLAQPLFAQDLEFENLIGSYEVSDTWLQNDATADQKKVLKARAVYLELKAVESDRVQSYAAFLHDAKTKRVIWEATWVGDKNDYFDLVRVDDPDVVYNCNYTEDDDTATITIFNYFGEDQPLVFESKN